MTKQAIEFLKKCCNGEYDIDSRADAKAFAGLSVEDRYEILKYHSAEIHPSVFIFAGEKGIIDILNSRFSKGTSLKEVAEELPDVYDYLYAFQPAEEGDMDYSKGWEKVLDELNIFKDKDGNIAKDKIIEYVSNNPNQIPCSERFKRLDVDTDREGIIKIIKGALLGCGWQNKQGRNIEVTGNMRRLFSNVQGEQKIPMDECIRMICRGEAGEAGESDEVEDYKLAQLASCIGMLYEAFESQMQGKYGTKIGEPEMQYNFSTCVMGAYESISSEAIKEAEAIVAKIQANGIDIGAFRDRGDKGNGDR